MTDIANQTAGGQIFTDVLSSFADRWGDLGFRPELGFLSWDTTWLKLIKK